MSEREGYSTGSMLLAFLLGGIVGAGVALMLAPQSGTETRRRVRDLTEDIIEKSTEYAEDVKQRISKGVEKGKETIQSTVEKGKDIYGEKRSAITSAIEAGKEAYEAEKERHKKA